MTFIFLNINTDRWFIYNTTYQHKCLDNIYANYSSHLVYMYNEFLILQDVFLTLKICSFYILRGIWYYFQVTIIGISSPLGASLYNISTRLCSQRTTSSSSKCRENIRWRRLFINKKINNCRAHSWTLRNDDIHDVTKKKVRIR